MSSNPTGPLHVGHGRWVATGDAIAVLLERLAALAARRVSSTVRRTAWSRLDTGCDVRDLATALQAVPSEPVLGAA